MHILDLKTHSASVWLLCKAELTSLFFRVNYKFGGKITSLVKHRDQMNDLFQVGDIMKLADHIVQRAK